MESKPMYKVALMQRLQATCHITSDVQQKTLFIDAVMVGTVITQVCLDVSLYNTLASVQMSML